MKYDFITIGGATEDITFYTSEGILIDNKKDLTRQKLLAFEYGAKIKIDKSFSGFGGGAANAAVCFASFGLKAACLAALGDDERGRRILNNFRGRGVNTDMIQAVKNHETGFSLLLVGPTNEHIVFSNRAANDELRITDYQLRVMGKAKWLYLTSLSGDWQPNLHRIFSLNGLTVAWNPGHRQIITGLKAIGGYFKKTACLIVNKDEAIELVMSDGKFKARGRNFLSSTKNLLKALASYGVRIVLITSGKAGADALAAGKFYHQPIIKERQRADTTGVGDAFGSGFISGLELYDGDVKKALKLAARNASSVISIPGAQNGLLNKDNI